MDKYAYKQKQAWAATLSHIPEPPPAGQNPLTSSAKLLFLKFTAYVLHKQYFPKG